MKLSLVLILLAAVSNANAANLSCLADGATKDDRTSMVQETDTRFVVVRDYVQENGSEGLQTTSLYVLDSSTKADGTAVYTGLAERQVGPDVFAKADFHLEIPQNLEKKASLMYSSEGKTYEELSFKCMHPDNR